MKPQEVTHFHLFGGSGSGAAGFKDADPTIGTIKGRMVLLESMTEYQMHLRAVYDKEGAST